MSPPDVVTPPTTPPGGVVLPRPVTSAVAVVVAAVVLAVLWVGVATGTLLAALDPALDRWMVAVRPPGAVATAVVASTVGQPAVVIGVLVVVAAAVAWRSRSWTPVAIAAGGVALLSLADNGVKAIVARPRPPEMWHAMPAHGLSFPSGHALWSAGTMLLIVVLVGPVRHRWAVGLAALLVVVVISGSRIVVAVHYPSDVLAGWALAVVADGIVLLVAAALVRRRRAP